MLELNGMFRAGRTPGPAPSGTYRGEFLAYHIAPGLTQLCRAVAALYMPWVGKHFDPAGAGGYNLLRRDSYPLVRLVWPFYRGTVMQGGGVFGGFPFMTSLAQGLDDPDRQVLRLDYDLPGNPRFGVNVRRVVDELVRIEGGLLLGKAHVRWCCGAHRMVAFFLLSP